MDQHEDLMRIPGLTGFLVPQSMSTGTGVGVRSGYATNLNLKFAVRRQPESTLPSLSLHL